MKTSSIVPVGAWSVALTFALAASWGLFASPPETALDTGFPALHPHAVPARPRMAELRAASDAIRRRNPFRADRGTFTPYPEQPSGDLTFFDPSPTPEPWVPTLTIAGIVGGPPWSAVVEGLPGAERGVVLGVGEEGFGVTILSIRGDTVEISGFDTTWTMTLKRPWT